MSDKDKNVDEKVESTEEVVEETANEAVEAAPVAEEVAKEVKAEEPVVEAKPEPAVVETPVETPVETKPSKELSGKLSKLATEIEGLTVLEMADLATYLEEKFGVSAMAMAAPVAGSAAAGAAEPTEEKSTYNVVLTDAGANKLGVIKAVREIKPDLGLMDAKKLVESAPKAVAEGVKKDEAEAAVKKLTEAGAKAELQ